MEAECLCLVVLQSCFGFRSMVNDALLVHADSRRFKGFKIWKCCRPGEGVKKKNTRDALAWRLSSAQVVQLIAPVIMVAVNK